MPNDLYTGLYNPDVLSCLANLSNDEVFTPPEVANAMLDLLPQELFESPDTRFLDPACKSGVFLREIAKRLIRGLADKIPDLQQRLDHIFHEQLYGIAITELTSLLSRRSVYCSKYPNGTYSVSKFDSAEGNIRFHRVEHRFREGRCVFCGAAKSQYDRESVLETHAYELIHKNKPEEIFKMRFDVIVSNPPYQLSTGGGQAQATPLYQRFVEQSIKLQPRYISMIIPSRWFSGGIGLKEFREKMMNDTHISRLVDYQNAKECFPGCSIGGGVSYFLWDSGYNGPCTITNISGEKTVQATRYLNEFSIVIRNNNAVSIIHKAKSLYTMDRIVSSISPFGLPTYTRGVNEKTASKRVALHSSGGMGYISESDIKSGREYLNKYKVLLSANTSEHAGEPRKDGTFKVFSTIEPLGPMEACTHSYILVGPCDTMKEVNNIISYLNTRFVRFLVLQTITGISVSKDKFMFVPLQDFSKPWTDEELYAKYGLTDEEIAFIESMIKPME